MKIGEKSRWRLLTALAAIPLTAIFHNLLFYRSECMLNSFGKEALPTYISWLSKDPSLPWAIIRAATIYTAGKSAPWLKTLVLPFLIGFLPLSIWIWDIPGTGRIICRSFHENKLVFPLFGPLHSRHLYVLGIIVWLGIFAVRKKQSSITGIENVPPEVTRTQ